MGQDLSKAITPPPLTLQDCTVQGRIDITRYLYYRRTLDHYMEADDLTATSRSKKRRGNSGEGRTKKKHRTARSVQRHKLLIRDSDGSLREIRPTNTLWYLLYVAHPPITPRIYKLFRLRFRLPYESFVELSDDIYNHPLFS